MLMNHKRRLALTTAVVLASTFFGAYSAEADDNAAAPSSQAPATTADVDDSVSPDTASSGEVAAEDPTPSDQPSLAPTEEAPTEGIPTEDTPSAPVAKAPAEVAPSEPKAAPKVATASPRLSAAPAAADVPCTPGPQDGAISSLKVEASDGTTTYDVWERIKVSFSGALPDGGCAGDTITIKLPDGLRGFDSTIPVLAADGTTMGSMVVRDGKAVITFNNYVETHDGITIDGYFNGSTTNTLQPGTDYDLQFVVGNEVFITPITTVPCTTGCTSTIGPGKAADFQIGSPNTVFYQLFAPATVNANDSLIFTDTLGPGQMFDCDQVWLQMGTTRDAWGAVVYNQDVSNRATITCDPATATITVTATSTAPGEYYKLAGRSIVTAERGSYADNGTVSVAGKTSDVHAVVRAQEGGVNGGGAERTPKIDIEKWSTDQGASAGDHDDAPGKPLDPNKDEAISFTIKNNGTERLVDVVVGDSTTGGTGTLKNVSCDFSPLGGPTTGLTWEGPFNVGDSFNCTGVLPALGTNATHQDTATVKAVGMYSDKPVDDKDLWNGTTPPTPSIDIEKWSTDQGASAGDHDDAPGKPLDPNKDEAISFTIKNNGTERLVDVVVGDSTTGGTGTLKNVSCDFSPLGGPTTGLTWEGPFNVGDSFNCTGVLPALGTNATHQDTATVKAVGETSKKPVDDKDLWNGTTPPIVGAVSSGEAVAPANHSSGADDDTSDHTNEDTNGLLPNTGLDGATLPLAAFGVLLLLAGVALIRRRTES